MADTDWVWAVRNRGEYYYIADLGTDLPDTASFDQCDGCGGPVDPETQEPTDYVRQGTARVSYVCETCGTEYRVSQRPAEDVVGVPF
jgi:hypothetical protein